MFSFYLTKSMISGEGRMITHETPELAHEYRLHRNQGIGKQYENEVVGHSLRMTNIYVTIGCERLKKLTDWAAKHRESAASLSANL